MELVKLNVRDNFYVAIIDTKSIFLISSVPKTEPIMQEIIDVTVYNNFASGPGLVPIPCNCPPQ